MSLAGRVVAELLHFALSKPARAGLEPQRSALGARLSSGSAAKTSSLE